MGGGVGWVGGGGGGGGGRGVRITSYYTCIVTHLLFKYNAFPLNPYDTDHCSR